MEYYRTGQGDHRHQDFYCANARRSIHTGDPVAIPADEIASWPACEHCCPAAEVRASAEAARAKADEMCRNSGVTHPKRINSACKDCGKTGAVQRGTGKLRAHKPQN